MALRYSLLREIFLMMAAKYSPPVEPMNLLQASSIINYPFCAAKVSLSLPNQIKTKVDGNSYGFFRA